MKKFLILAASALSIATAQAADMPTKATPGPVGYPSYIWSGPYIGGTLGYGISQQSMAVSGVDANGIFAVNSGLVPASIKTKPDGLAGGLTVGYNLQHLILVYGIEGDISFADIDGGDSRTLAFGPARLTSSANSKLDWFATARARLGVTPLANLLLYGTGGAAFAGIQNDMSAALTFPGFNATAASASDKTRIGWVAGAGVEYAVAPQWTVKAEYLYMDFGTETSVAAGTLFGAPVTFSNSHRDAYHIGRVGANWRF